MVTRIRYTSKGRTSYPDDRDAVTDFKKKRRRDYVSFGRIWIAIAVLTGLALAYELGSQEPKLKKKARKVSYEVSWSQWLLDNRKAVQFEAWNETMSNSSTAIWPKSRFAFVFLIAGCDPNNPEGYWGYFMNLFVAKFIFETSGSKADMMVMIKMTYTSPISTLPREQHEALEKAGIRVVYIKQAEHESMDTFYAAMMDKFRMLKYIEYERMLFMDSDVIPLCNLDYLFEMADQRKIAPNLVLAWKSVPANGGFFMLSNEEGDYETIMEYVHHRYFDENVGFGHRIEPGDEWKCLAVRSNNKMEYRRKWAFYGADADQGLLYHWVKYHKKNVTIVWGRTAETWGRDEASGNVTLLWSKPDFFSGCEAPLHLEKSPPYTGNYATAPVYKDFIHFTEESKPFLIDPSLWKKYTFSDYRQKEAVRPKEVWFTALKQACDHYGVRRVVDTVELTEKGKGTPTLGLLIDENGRTFFPFPFTGPNVPLFYQNFYEIQICLDSWSCTIKMFVNTVQDIMLLGITVRGVLSF